MLPMILRPVLALLVLGLFFAIHTPPPTTAQDRPTISTDTAAQVTLLETRGRGRMLNMGWQGGDLIVHSTLGVWRIPLAGPVPDAPFIDFNQPGVRTLRAFAIGDNLLAGLQSARTITVYNNDGTPRHQIVLDDNLFRTNHLAFTNGDAQLVVSTFDTDTDTGRLLVYDLTTLDITAQVAFEGFDVQETAISGQQAVVYRTPNADGMAALELIDLQTGETRWQILHDRKDETLTPLFNIINGLYFSPDGSRVATVSAGGVYFIDASSGAIDRAADRDDKDLVVAVYDMVFTGEEEIAFVETRFRGMEGALLLGTAGSDDFTEVEGTSGFYDHIAINATGNFIAYGGYAGEIMLRNLDAGVSQLLVDGFIGTGDVLAVSGDTLYTGGFDGALRQWSPDGTVRTNSIIGNQEPYALTLNADGSQLLYVTGNENIFFAGTFTTPDLTLSERFSLPVPPANSTVARLTTAQFASNGTVAIAAVGVFGNLFIWPDATNPDTAGAFELTINTAGRPVYSPYTDTLFVLESGNPGATLRLIEGVEVVRSLQFDVSREVTVVQLLPGPNDDTLLIVTNPGCRLVLLDIAGNGETLAESTGRENCRHVAQSPVDDNLVATLVTDADFQNVVQLRNVETGEIYAELRGNGWGILDTTFSADGTQLFTGGYDGVVRVWGVGEVRRGD
jgi:WD40 repeat protein